MGEVAPLSFGRGTGLVSRDDMVRGLNNVSMAAPRVGGDYQFLKLDKGNGEWIYGQEETPVEDGSLWAINPLSLEYGYISWDKNQQVEGEVMVPITRPLPTELRVKDSPDGKPTGQNGWQYQQSLVMVCVKGEDAEGTPVACQYKQSSVGSQKLFKTIIDAISAQIAKGSDEIVPIVEMKSDSYKHKKYGKIYNPVFEIVEWRTMDDDSAPEAPAAEEAAPARRTRAAAPASAPPPVADEDAALEAEYAQEAAQAQANPTPRRRVRR
jgi:hypothetical protein